MYMKDNGKYMEILIWKKLSKCVFILQINFHNPINNWKKNIILKNLNKN
jgi:hypothetical protein